MASTFTYSQQTQRASTKQIRYAHNNTKRNGVYYLNESETRKKGFTLTRWGLNHNITLSVELEQQNRSSNHQRNALLQRQFQRNRYTQNTPYTFLCLVPNKSYFMSVEQCVARCVKRIVCCIMIQIDSNI